MSTESTKPIPVQSSDSGAAIFFIRQFFDLQLNTIASSLRQLLPSLEGRILDIGADQSPWRNWLNSSACYQGVDIENSDSFGMQRQDDLIYYNGTTLPFFDDTFDAAICIEVLEHVAAPELLLRESFRVLKPGAIFALSVPWSARRHHIPHDFYRFTRERLQQMFHESGFVNIEIQERGNDVCVVANKLIVMGWRLVCPQRISSLIWTLPLALIELPLAAAMLVCAHLSLLLGLGSREDPLGYFVTCNKVDDVCGGTN